MNHFSLFSIWNSNGSSMLSKNVVCLFSFFVGISEGTWIRSNCIVCMWTHNFLIMNDDNDANGEKKNQFKCCNQYLLCEWRRFERRRARLHIRSHIGFWYRAQNIAPCACTLWLKWLKRFECQNLIRLIRSMAGWLNRFYFLQFFVGFSVMDRLWNKTTG